jgi:hypothetical protein
MVAEGALSDIRIVDVNYLQHWLSEALTEDNKQAKWRMEGSIGWWRHRRYRHPCL